MKKVYITMQKDLMDKINDLEAQVSEHEADIQNKDELISALDQEIKEECIKKDLQIEQLQRQIDEMSSDFAEMLRQTLSKMQERIELANVQWDNDDDNENMLQKS
uniref:Dynein regulatory complex protein 12 n=1 Tax=Euplotes harpa TaxID=151035 RepID=A0A7S3J1E4_9SPIT|mmetsp:Transcript_11818/g.13419  ORF Transcript_11818/g.13419 Transcript_11818/m.13419 type:complete len:105 (+) Transcript_11818:229-543(+)